MKRAVHGGSRHTARLARDVRVDRTEGVIGAGPDVQLHRHARAGQPSSIFQRHFQERSIAPMWMKVGGRPEKSSAREGEA